MRLRTIGVVAPIAIISAAFLWAFDGVVLTPWVNDLGLWDVPTFVLMLHATASVFLTYFIVKRRQELRQLNKKDWLAFILTGLFGGAIGTMAIVGAIIEVHTAHLNISVVLLLQKLQPIFAIILALLILRERPRSIFYFWGIMALLGSYLLTFGLAAPDFSAEGMLLPALLAILAAFSFGSSTVFSKRAVAKVSHGLGTALRFLITTGIMAVIITIITILKASGVSTMYAGWSGLESITWSMIGAFVLIALTTGGTAIFIYYWGLKRVTASRSTIFEMAFPVSAVILEYIIHGSMLSAGQWIGAILVVGSIMAIVNLQKSRKVISAVRI